MHRTKYASEFKEGAKKVFNTLSYARNENFHLDERKTLQMSYIFNGFFFA